MPSYRKLIWFVLFGVSCTPTKPAAIGGMDTLILFCDSISVPIIATPLQKTYLMPRAETVFLVQHQTMDQFSIYQNFRYLLFAGTLDGHDAVSEWIRSTLSPDDEKAIRDGQTWILEKKSPWAQEQFLWVLCTATRTEMIQRVESEGFMLLQRLEDERRHQELAMMRQDQYGKIHPRILGADTCYVFEDFALQPISMPESFFWYRSTERFQEWILFSTLTSDSTKVTQSIERQAQKLLHALPDSLIFRNDFMTNDTVHTVAGPILRMCTIWTTKNQINAFGGPLWLYVPLTPTDKPKKLSIALTFGPQNERKHSAMRQLENLIIYNITHSYE